MNVKVTIYEGDKIHGVRGDCVFCPVASALKRVVNKCSSVYVEDDAVTFSRDGSIDQHVYLPEGAQNWIEQFDANRDHRCPVPFSFDLEIPTEFIESC